MDKVQPKGQIRPAAAFCLARGEHFSAQVSFVLSRNLTFFSCILKIVSQKAPQKIETALEAKKLPTPDLKGPP